MIPQPASASDTALPSAQALDELLAAVRHEPWAYDFFALLRRLDALRPAQPRTGYAMRPGQELLRLSQVPELNFAPAPLDHLEFRPDAPPRLGVRFFGLLGPNGPMPLHFTEFVRERRHNHGDSAAAHFLDIFHHRMLTLFYRAWAQNQPVVHADRPQDDRFMVWLGALAGTPGRRPTHVLPAQALAFQAGLLSLRTRPPEALARVLRQYFKVPVEVIGNAPQWLVLADDDRSALGHARNRPERARQPGARLGHAIAGDRVWDRQYRLRVRLGPLPRSGYMAFLPGGAQWPALLEWLDLLIRPELQWELELVLADADRPPPRLSRGVHLGVSSWLAPRRTAEPTFRPLRLRASTSFLLRHPLSAGA